MSDIADMLGIANKAPSGNVASEEALKIMGEKTKIVKGGKKPKGMSREVFDLLGKDGLVPAIQGNVVAPNFKSKRINALKGKWVWTPITSSARQNNQPAFFHWIKADQTYVDYPYASFNVKFDTFQYTDDEYEKYLSADPAWSRADTDQLVQVCHRFDMRWPVISDRIELSTPRAVESMQDRYYSVRATIQAKRMEQTSGSATAVQAPSSGFNVEQERKRRRAQDMLFKKTKEDELEELQLREELKSIDAALKKNKKAKTAATVDTTSAAAGSASAPAAASNAAVAAPAALGPGLQARTILAAPGANGVPEEAGKGAAPAVVAAIPLGPAAGRPCLQSSRLYAGTVPPIALTGSLNEYGVSRQDTGQTGVNLSKKMLNKMTMYLRELEIPENPLPTKAVCDLVEQVKLDAVTVLSLHNLIGRKEKELALLQAGGGAADAAGGGEAGAPKAKGGRAAVKKEAGAKGRAGAGEEAWAGQTGGGAGEGSGEAVWLKTEPGSEGGDDQSSNTSAMYMDVVDEAG